MTIWSIFLENHVGNLKRDLMRLFVDRGLGGFGFILL